MALKPASPSASRNDLSLPPSLASSPPGPGGDEQAKVAIILGPDQLSLPEQFWRDQYTWLLEAGYRLRSRYEPGWKPTWPDTGRRPYEFEDSHAVLFPGISHATELKTGRFVTIKRVNIQEHPYELEVTRYLSSGAAASDPSNHAVQPIEILEHPADAKFVFIVLPLLRNYDDPPFETVGEIIGFIGQFLEGMEFLHENKIIHGDISINNIMMDASGMYPEGFHPIKQDLASDFYGGPISAKYTRTERPPRYHLIDFGLSFKFEGDDNLPIAPGTDLTVPEYHDNTKPLNGFAIDVYCAGNLLRQDFLDGNADRLDSSGFKKLEFLRPLVNDMVQENADARPTMGEVLTRFEKAVKSLSFVTLRSRCVPKDAEPPLVLLLLSAQHWLKTISYIARRLPAIPKAENTKPKAIEAGKGEPELIDDTDAELPVHDSVAEGSPPEDPTPGSPIAGSHPTEDTALLDRIKVQV